MRVVLAPRFISGRIGGAGRELFKMLFLDYICWLRIRMLL